jgi:hypothetical protein
VHRSLLCGWHDEAMTIAPPRSGVRVGSLHILVIGVVVGSRPTRR